MIKCPISVSPEAILKLKGFMTEAPESKYIRVGVKGAGCSGYTWVLDLAIEAKERDYVFLIEDVSFIVDAISYNYLKDTQIGWKESLMGSGFTFSSQKVKTCGCGESFSLTNE